MPTKKTCGGAKREPLQKKGKQGDNKLRNRPKTDGEVEFYCLSCKSNRRVKRDIKNLCLKELKNKVYLLTNAHCEKCKHKTSKFVTEKQAKHLMEAGVVKCDKMKNSLNKAMKFFGLN